MATAANRQAKLPKKGVADSARRPPGSAWNGARASPTFSPGSTSPRLPNGPPAGSQGAFPPLGGQTNGNRPQDNNPNERVLQHLSGLTGTTITLITKTAQRYEGVIFSTSPEGNTAGVTLKDVKEITNPGTPLKEQLFIASTNIDQWTSGPADAKVPNGDSFRTDTDISGKGKFGRERELQAWQPEPDGAGSSSGPGGDDLTFGPANPGNNNNSWDQFAVNEKLFGVKTNFNEDLYTTKLDRSAADFKEREKKAQKIANEIIGGATTNPHIAEERQMNSVDDSGVNEEDKYGAVVRGTGAYVPPGARKGPLSPPLPGAPKADIPKVAVNAPDGAAVPDKEGSPAPANKPPADPLPAFRDFVTNEKQRLTQKRQALVKSEMDKRMAELKKFSQSFKLNKPIPDDLVSILAKDEEKQKQIREKATKDASSDSARTIGINSVLNPTPGNPPRNVVAQPVAGKSGASKVAAAPAGASKPTAAPAKTAAATKPSSDPKATGKGGINMVIQAIPPFKGRGVRSPNAAPTASGTSQTSGSSSNASKVDVVPTSPTSAARLNVNASSFRPNPKANAFSPVQSPSPNATSTTSSKAKPAESVSTTPNPFFGTRAPKTHTVPVNIKDDFNPFKHNKVVKANEVSAMWPYSGKRYAQLFPPLPHNPPQHSPHMAQPGPPPMPPPSYEEDSAQQAAARGYVYAPYPYAYPGQPMMPPPGPPGAYMPGPYMQPMHYPPGMPPPNGQPMFSPNMGHMPPPQGYMPPPQPGQYPPPPNGAGPRPPMPSTPIPSHAHPYYQQSPQLQHAVPYPMMMPPPSNVPHPYEGGPAPPVQMGGHA